MTVSRSTALSPVADARSDVPGAVGSASDVPGAVGSASDVPGAVGSASDVPAPSTSSSLRRFLLLAALATPLASTAADAPRADLCDGEWVMVDGELKCVFPHADDRPASLAVRDYLQGHLGWTDPLVETETNVDPGPDWLGTLGAGEVVAIYVRGGDVALPPAFKVLDETWLPTGSTVIVAKVLASGTFYLDADKHAELTTVGVFSAK